MAKDRRDTSTNDLFCHERLFPVETPRELENALDFNARVSQAIKRALDEAKRLEKLAPIEITPRRGTR